MSTAAEAKEKDRRQRKSPARHRDVVIAAIEERMCIIVRDDANEVHLRRLEELIDELKRALKGNSKPEDEEA